MENNFLRDQLLAADANGRVQLLFDYLTRHGDENYEEDVTQMQHGLQAAYLAKDAGQDPEYITAALFHDIGHILADDPDEKNNPTLKDDNHEDIAASFFRDIFPDKVIEPIRLHVTAKRYLCTVNEAYYQGLSEPSQKSFHLQGGNMSAEELAAFEANPFHQAAVQLRIWDDTAKDVHAEVPTLNDYWEIVSDSLLDEPAIGILGE
ncbi:MAG: HD domain-containing protein [Saprospiraceae bacterium]|nr:HD domain-containing protein [Saprospiraceae bacterium]MDP4997876.1 HD domain-containing protein [Saprospiraceae bacterium]